MNKLLDMNKQEIIKDGIVNNNYIRIVSSVQHEWDSKIDDTVLVSKAYKLQIKIHGLLLSKYLTIKEWIVDITDEKDDILAKNEATELFNNIINPYKNYG